MAEIVNLNRHRKQAARAQDARQAEANRVKFGRDKPTRAREEQAEARRRALLDGARLEAAPVALEKVGAPLTLSPPGD